MWYDFSIRISARAYIKHLIGIQIWKFCIGIEINYIQKLSASELFTRRGSNDQYLVKFSVCCWWRGNYPTLLWVEDGLVPCFGTLWGSFCGKIINGQCLMATEQTVCINSCHTRLNCLKLLIHCAWKLTVTSLSFTCLLHAFHNEPDSMTTIIIYCVMQVICSFGCILIMQFFFLNYRI